MLMFFMIIVMWSEHVHAHKVMIFAWVEGDTVYSESKFSGGRMVKHGKIIVYDLEGNKLLDGRTDEKGAFNFKLPNRNGMKVVLEAGMGHRAEWTIPLNELQGINNLRSESKEGTAIISTAVRTAKKPVYPVNGGGIAAEDIENAVEKALDEKLKPIIQMLADMHEQGPDVSDVLGGIGYILGLMGVASYFHYRQKRKEGSLR